MLASILSVLLHKLNEPDFFVRLGVGYVIAYYLAAWAFHHANQTTYSGHLKKPLARNGVLDWLTSSVWIIGGILLFSSLMSLLYQEQDHLPLTYLLLYYLLFLFIFAFMYSILEWHWSGSLSQMPETWKGEVHSVVLSIQVMTGSSLTSTTPLKLRAQMVAAFQSLLGLLFVAVFIAKAINRLSN